MASEDLNNVSFEDVASQSGRVAASRVEGGAVEKRGGTKEVSSVDTGAFVGPTGESFSQTNTVKNNRPVKCASCGQQAIVRPDFLDRGPTNLCQRHWDQKKHDVDSYKPGPYWLEGGVDEANKIRSEDYIRRLKGRNAASAVHFDATQEHVPVATPGRPYKSEEQRFDEQEARAGRGYVEDVVSGKGREGGRTKLRPIDQPSEDSTKDWTVAAQEYNDSYGDEQDYYNAISDLMQ
jgi:hypothetical protein